MNEAYVKAMLEFLCKRLASEIPNIARARLYPVVDNCAQNEIQQAGGRALVDQQMEYVFRHILERVTTAKADYDADLGETEQPPTTQTGFYG